MGRIGGNEGYENITPSVKPPAPLSVARGCWQSSVVDVEVSAGGRCRVAVVSGELSGTAGGGSRRGTAVDGESRR